MLRAEVQLVLRRLFRRAGAAASGELPDGALLEQFAHSHNEAAFAALVERHGPLVLGVCRRVLGHRQDAEDAFQATFLILARRAASLRRDGSLAPWLHTVAYRLALRAHADAARRPAGGARDLDMLSAKPEAADAWQDVQPVLDEELQRLPEKYRVPVVLCYLEGQTHAEAARQLGWPKGTVAGRLARARELLRARLERRGVTLSAGVLAAVLAEHARAAPVPVAFAHLTTRGAVAFATTSTAAGVSAQVVTLAVGGLQAMFTAKSKLGVLVLASVLVVGGAAVWAQQVLRTKPDEGEQRAVNLPGPAEDEQQVRMERNEDPLPDGARFRVGSDRFQHAGDIRQLTFSRDGMLVISLSDDATLRGWEVPTGKELYRVPLNRWARSEWFFTLAPDGRTLATEIGGRTWLVEAATGKKIQPFGTALCGTFSTDGKMLTTLEADRIANVHVLTVWDVATGAKVGQRNLEGGEVNLHYGRYAFSPDGKVLAVVEDGKDHTIHLWETATGKKLRSWDVPRPFHHNLAFSPDSKLLATGTSVLTVRIWQVDTGKELHRWKGYSLVEGDSFGVTWLDFAPDGKTLFYPSGVALHQCDWATGKEIRRFENVMGPVAVLSDGKLVAAEGTHNDIRLLDPATGKDLCPQRRIGPFEPVLFSPGGKRVTWTTRESVRRRDEATGKEFWDSHPTLHLWDLDRGKEVGRLDGAAAPLAFTPDGRLLAAFESHKTIRLWDTTTGKPLRRFEQEGVSWFAFTPDGKTLATGDGQRAACLWDVATGKQVRRFEGSGVLIFSEDAQTVASASHKGGTVRLWQAATGKELGPLRGYQPKTGYKIQQRVRSVRGSETTFPLIMGGGGGQFTPLFSPDGKTILAGGEYDLEARVSTLRLWDVATGRQLPNGLSGEQFVLKDVTFSPDGKLLALMTSRGAVCLWDASTGIVFRTLEEGEGEFSVAPVFSPDGKLLATTRHDGAIRIWEVVTGKALCRISAHRGPIRRLLFSPDGRSLATTGADHAALVWDMTNLVGDGRPPNAQLTALELERRWADLAGQDAQRARQALEDLLAAANRAVPFLQERLRPVAAPDPQRLARLIAELGADPFAVREQAVRDLEEQGDVAVPALRQALAAEPTLEVRQRLNTLLEKLATQALPPTTLRAVRAVELLERAGGPAANEVLAKLAQGAVGARLTEDARAALARTGRLAAVAVP